MEQAAWNYYASMSGSDRRSVDRWMRLGNSRLDAIIAVKQVRLGLRRNPDAESQVVTWRDAHERWPTGSLARRIRKTAEHEAVHVTLGEELGMAVASAVVRDDGSGETRYEPAGSLVDQVAMVMGPAWWSADFRNDTFPEGDAGCEQDHRKAVLELGAGPTALAEARKRAGAILGARYRDILALADTLESRRKIVFGDSPRK
jgi:hypothetical protein